MSHELHALAHHVELTKSGWRDRAIELITIKAIDSGDLTSTRTEVSERVNSMLAAPLAKSQVVSMIEKLIHSGKVVETRNGYVKLSESVKSELHSQLEIQNQREAKVCELFEGTFEDQKEVDITWIEFRDEFLYPLVSELGVRAYELLSGESVDLEQADSHMRFIDRFPVESRGVVGDRIAAFLDARNIDVRNYVLRVLNAVFLVQATHLRDSTLKFIYAKASKPLKLHVFVDTNFLFSLIGLHANPADDVTGALHQLISQLNDQLDVKLYMLPITNDEAKRTIIGYENRLHGLNLTTAMSLVARNGTKDLSGITGKFIEEALKRGSRVSAKEYFKPYNENLLRITRSKGIELYNESTDSICVDQLVIDDVERQIEYEKENRPENRRKSYEKVLHDVVLWHFTRRKRPERLESPLEAEYWAATIDFGLLSFDRHKRRGRTAEPPVCIHPTALLQILQLWIPSSELLETALVNSLQPLLPHEFDRKAEEVTIRILRSLSSLENSSTLGQDTVAHILLDDAVRSRIEVADTEDEQNQVVQSALADDLKKMEQKTAKLERKVHALESEITEKGNESDTLRSELEHNRSKHRSLEESYENERESRLNLERDLYDLEQSKLRNSVLAKTLVLSVLGGLFVALVTWAVFAIAGLPEDVLWVAVSSLGIGGILAVSSTMTLIHKPVLYLIPWIGYIRRFTAGYWILVILGLIVEILGSWVSTRL